MAGLMPDSMLFGSADLGHLPNRRDLADALQHALQRRDRTLKDLLSKPRREPGTQDILRQTQEDVEAGKMEGPWEVYRGRGGEVVSTVPFAEWLPTQRFPRVQHHAATSYDVLGGGHERGEPHDSHGLDGRGCGVEAVQLSMGRTS